MTTLIEYRNREGKITGRCDARCHNAKRPKCKCVCGGLNHGVGLTEAKAWTILAAAYLTAHAPAGHTTKLYKPPTRFQGEPTGNSMLSKITLVSLLTVVVYSP